MALEVTKDSFEKEVMDEHLPVLVDFWAPWCVPCRRIAPLIEEIDQRYKGKLKVGKVNVDDYPELAAKFNVMSIPTLILFKNGKVLKQYSGVLSKEKLIDFVRECV